MYPQEEEQQQEQSLSLVDRNIFPYITLFSVTLSCGLESTENITYFESTDSAATEPGSCSARICAATNNICRIRLDFDSFVITGPSTDTVTQLTATGGIPAGMDGNVPVALKGQCLTDRFSVSGDRGSSSNTICGVNSGEHSNYFSFPFK